MPGGFVEDPPGQAFLVGNKRSGTSFLGKVLSAHLELYMPHEADLVWILYQARNGLPEKFRGYPWDGPVGMQATLNATGAVLRDRLAAGATDEALRGCFFAMLDHLMRHGSAVQPPMVRPGVRWVGDKKPVQQCDPELRPFMNRLFPEARYIHIVRDPRAVVASMMQAAREWAAGVPPYWTGSAGEILERWAVHEEWALRIGAEEGRPLYTVRHEDLCADPVAEVRKLYAFLDCDMPQGVARGLPELTRRDPNRKYAGFPLPSVPRAERLMAEYGYRRATA